MDTDPNRWYSDPEIIEGIQKGRETRQDLTKYLFNRHKPLLALGINHHKLKEGDVCEVYSDAVISMSLQIESDKFNRETAIETHFNKIVKERCKKISDLEG